jgi:hypothetical protein
MSTHPSEISPVEVAGNIPPLTDLTSPTGGGVARAISSSEILRGLLQPFALSENGPPGVGSAEEQVELELEVEVDPVHPLGVRGGTSSMSLRAKYELRPSALGFDIKLEER